jgi:sigma-B regulation protein RsbU (phosphoserine phosphatase)
MSLKRKLLLSYLLLIVIVAGLFIATEGFISHHTWSSNLLYPAVFIILFVSGLISLFLARYFFSPIIGLQNVLREIEGEGQERLSASSNDETGGLSELASRISRQLKESEQKLRVLFEIGKIVSSLLHLQQVLDAIVDLLTREYRLDACSIRLLDEGGNLRIMSHKGLSKAFVETATRKPTIDSYSGEVFLTGKIVMINDAEEIDKPISTTLLVGEDIKSFAVVPIQVEEKTIGVLVTASRRKNHFHERFNDVICIIASQIGAAITISQLYDESRKFGQELEERLRERTERLEEKAKQLVQAERLAARGKIANRVADECRNSLTIVGGFARRLYENAPDHDPDKEYLEIIVREIKNLEDKVSQITKIGNEDQ